MDAEQGHAGWSFNEDEALDRRWCTLGSRISSICRAPRQLTIPIGSHEPR